MCPATRYHKVAAMLRPVQPRISRSGNAVDSGGSFGTQIAWYNEAWFNNAPAGNFRLTTLGRSAIPQVAARGAGDPLVDIDGQSRPTSAGFPGLDQ